MNSAPDIYISDPATKEFIGTGIADQNPLDPGNWLIPGFSFLDKPPGEKQGFAIVRSDDGLSWVYKEDARGKTLFRKSNGSSLVYSEIGNPPDSLTEIPWPGEFYIWKEKDWALDLEAKTASQLLLATAERDSRLAEAAIRIAPLQDAVDLDEATDQEVADLKLWKQYRVLVNRVNAQPGFPSDISWPKRPGQK